MSDNKTIDNVHVHIYGHEMLGEVISRARKNNIPYDKDMYYDFHSHGHSYLVFKDGELTLLEDPTPSHYKETSLNYFFELYLSKEEVKKELEVGKWYWISNKDTHYEDTDKTRVNALIFDNGEERSYGFNFIGTWSSNFYLKGNIDLILRSATPQEVEKALIEEAKRRYKVGDKLSLFDGYYYGGGNNIYGGNFDCNSFDLEDTYLSVKTTNGWYHRIFYNGQWSSIIEQDKFVELKEAHKNGAVIQYYANSSSKWEDVVNNDPLWKDYIEYRIKPEEKPKVGDWVQLSNSNIRKVLTDFEADKWREKKTLTQQEAIALLFPNK